MELAKINFEKKGLNSLIGGLEADIMDCLWQENSKRNCREVYAFVKKKNKVAYTTIAVTLDRMYARGFVGREIEKGKGGLRYNYYSKVSKGELADRVSKKFIGFLKKTFGESSIAYLKKNI